MLTLDHSSYFVGEKNGQNVQSGLAEGISENNSQLLYSTKRCMWRLFHWTTIEPGKELHTPKSAFSAVQEVIYFNWIYL